MALTANQNIKIPCIVVVLITNVIFVVGITDSKSYVTSINTLRPWGGIWTNTITTCPLCVDLAQCFSAQNILRQPNGIQRLIQITCGFMGKRPYVCCPEVVGNGIYNEEDDMVGDDPTVYEDAPFNGNSPSSSTYRSDTETRFSGTDDNHKLFPNKEKCGISYPAVSPPGEPLGPGAFPWIVRIGYRVANGGEYEFRCSGSLINKRYVLTSAQCVSALVIDAIKLRLAIIRLGEWDARLDTGVELPAHTPEPIDYRAETVTVHESFDPKTLINDIALIRLDDNVQFTEFVGPVCLPFGANSHRHALGVSVESTGWGINKIDEEAASSSLQSTWLRTAESSRCGMKENPTQICACAGDIDFLENVVDIGGPLMLGPYIVGVASGPASTVRAYFFTKVPEYISWISQKVKA